jgi:hypothetical protein
MPVSLAEGAKYYISDPALVFSEIMFVTMYDYHPFMLTILGCAGASFREMKQLSKPKKDILIVPHILR